MDRLVKQAQKGDKDAFVTLMEAHKRPLIAAARAILRDEDDVADVLQETVISAFQKLYTLREIKYFKTWLTRILMNHCYELLRKKKMIQIADFLPEAGACQELDTALDVKNSLAALGDNDRLVLTLYYLEDMSQQDIGKILGISENAVKQRLARGKRHFKSKYEKGAACNE